jgi:aspartate/methionine/tyrosine aminotransferase
VDVPGLTSKQVADALLAEDGVALLAGTAFGEHGEGFLRLSFATSMAELEEGLARIERGVSRLRAATK